MKKKDLNPNVIEDVKTPVLAIIVDRDNEIQNFSKRISYRLEMDNGALSETVFDSREKAEAALDKSRGTSLILNPIL